MRDTRHIYKDKRGRLIAAISINGKQRLKRVKDKEQARQWFLCMETQSTKAAELTFKQLNDAANALDLLRKAGVTPNLEQVVKEWLAGASSAPQAKESRTFKEAIEEYLQRSEARVSSGTLKNYELMLSKFMAAVGGDSLVEDFKKPSAIAYLDRFLSKPPTWLAYQRALSRFFTECVRMEWTPANPFLGLSAPKCRPPERKFLSVEDTRKALDSVLKRQPHLIHFMTLGLFAGIRPVESLRLSAKNVNLMTGYIILTGDITKSHSFKERVVPINDTLRAWLTAYPFDEKPIPANNISYVDKAIRECADKDGWPRTPDCLRHSFATYRFGLDLDSAGVASICGHSEAVAQKFYRGRVTKEEAEQFFSILPAS